MREEGQWVAWDLYSQDQNYTPKFNAVLIQKFEGPNAFFSKSIDKGINCRRGRMR